MKVVMCLDEYGDWRDGCGFDLAKGSTDKDLINMVELFGENAPDELGLILIDIPDEATDYVFAEGNVLYVIDGKIHRI